ncbi:MAG TPA: hypothetical protein VLZ81_00020, partial [Blastocatellia bacterium]|nr:hypothetical protein [Blastocatellia bacterium]
SNLETLRERAQNIDDRLIQVAYHGAAGAALFWEHKYKEAISHLEEDTDSPLSLKLLAAAYLKVGDSGNAKRITETLTNLNDPTLEQALVVPAFRKCYADPTCNGDVKSAQLK